MGKTSPARRLLLLLSAVMLCAPACSEKDGGGEPAPGPDEQIDRWMADYMTTHYLWAEAMPLVTPDYTLGYEAFLDKLLLDIAARNDINHDDGHWENGVRQYFYSNIERRPASAAATRGTHRTEVGTGIDYLFYGSIAGDKKAPYYLQVRSVSPHSPAGRAGLRRGDYILRVDGQPISDWNRTARQLRDSKSKLILSVAESLRGETEDVSFTAGSYADNPVWKSEVLTIADGTKVGYLCYDAFNYYYDDALIAACADLKARGAGELVLDLRYNGGGHVVSSAVMATLVAGAPREGELFARTSYNARRTAASERVDRYAIGTADIGNGSYAPIAAALPAALGLERVYVLCTGSTASASELVINGLRGIDLDVRLIGTTTNGKNVGMEPRTRTFDGYEYEFSPITFYSANKKGFRDYGNGFAPQVTVDEQKVAVYDFGDPRDAFLSAALAWIEQGVRPAAFSTSVHAAEPGSPASLSTDVHAVPAPKRPLDGMIRLQEYIQ